MGGAWTAVVPWALAGAVAIALVRTARLRRREPGFALRQRAGLVLLTAPILVLLFVGLSSLSSLTQPGATVPLSPSRLADKTMVHLVVYLVTPLVGLVLTQGPKRALESARARLLPDGEPARTALASACAWSALLSAGLIMGVSMAWGLARAHGGGLFTAGGAEVVFSQVTPGLALLLAAVAAVAEESIFRGVLLEQFERIGPRWFAIGLQAFLFALIHAGYGSTVHVIASGAFGVLMGVLVTRKGLIPAVATHFLVNVAILGLWAGLPGLLVLAGGALVLLLWAAWHLGDPASTEREPRTFVRSA